MPATGATRGNLRGLLGARWQVRSRAAESRAVGPAVGGVVARIVTGPHEAHRQDPHLPMRYDTGRPRAVIRLRISQPRTTSLPPAQLDSGREGHRR